MTFGQLCKWRRRRLGLDQLTVAKTVGISQAYLSMIENDKRTPPFDVFYELILALSEHTNPDLTIPKSIFNKWKSIWEGSDIDI